MTPESEPAIINCYDQTDLKKKKTEHGFQLWNYTLRYEA